jgi:hypothetical protein
MSLYRMPKKPTILMVKGFCPIECVSVPHFLDLKLLGKLFGVKTPPAMWTDQTIRQVLKSAGRQLELSEGDDRLALLITHPISSGPATQLGPHKSCIGFEKRRSVMVERRKYLPATEPEIPNIPLYEERIYSSNVPKIGTNSRKKRRLYTGDTPHNHLRHRRDIGKKGIRVTQRGKKIGHSYGIYTLYVTSPMNTGPIVSFEELEIEIANKKYGNQIIPLHLAPEFEITVEIYFPVNPTYSAKQSGAPLDFGEGVSSAPVLLKQVLRRRDLCRLVADKALLRYCFRIGHGFSYEYASEEEVAEMELAWSKLVTYLLNRSRWRRGHRPDALDLEVSSSASNTHSSHSSEDVEDKMSQCMKRDTPSADILQNEKSVTEQFRNKVEKAMQMMSSYASDISAHELVQSPEKMITPPPVMKGPPRPAVTDDQLVDPFAADYVGETVDFSAVTDKDKPAEVVVAEEVVEVEKEVKEELLLDKSNELVLSLPLCIFNKTCRICSDVLRRPNVFLQIMVWQRGCELGIVAFDHELNDVYFVQPSTLQQEHLCNELEPAGVTELSINMGVFMMSLIYEEKEFDIETGEEIVVESAMRLQAEDISLLGSDSGSDSDNDNDKEDKAVENGKEEERSGSDLAKNKMARKKTRIQGFLTLAEDIPEDQEEDFAREEENEQIEEEGGKLEPAEDDEVDFDDLG